MTTDTPNDRRERYMAALTFADPYSLLWHRDDRVRLADAVMALADAEQAAALHAAADAVAALDRRTVGIAADTIKDAWEEGCDEAADELRRRADQAQYGDDAEMAASYRRDGFGPDEIAELLRAPGSVTR